MRKFRWLIFVILWFLIFVNFTSFVSSACPDANNDTKVNVLDLAITIFNQGRSPAVQGYGHLDFTGDGNINWNDVQEVIKVMGQSCSQIVEPTYANCAEVIAAGETTGYSNGCVEVYNCGDFNTGNTYYLLMNDVAANGTCFYLGTPLGNYETSYNITLNLNKYTLTWGQNAPYVADCGGHSGYVCYYGIRARLVQNLTVKNGDIFQQTGVLNPLTFSEAVYISGWDVEIANLNISVYSNDSNVIVFSAGRRARIHDNEIYSTAKIITDRMLIMSGIRVGGDAADAEVYNNRIIGVPQNGISCAWARTPTYPIDTPVNCDIHHNYVSQNAALTTNGYAISTDAFSQIHDNIINTTSGRGIASSRGRLIIYNNFVNVSQPNTGEGGSSTAHGIQFEDYAQHVTIYNNTVLSYSSLPDGNAAPLNIHVCFVDSNFTIYNNTFVSVFRGGSDGNGQCIILGGEGSVPGCGGTAINFGIDTLSAACGGYTFYDNLFISNSRAISGYSNGGIRGMNFTNNQFIYNPAPYSSRFFVPVASSSFNNIFTNTTLQGYSYRDSVAGGTANYSVRWYLKINSTSFGSPVNASVWIRDATGGIITDITGTDGVLDLTLREFDREMTPAISDTNYTNYTVNVTYLGETISRQVNLTSSKTETFTF